MIKYLKGALFAVQADVSAMYIARSRHKLSLYMCITQNDSVLGPDVFGIHPTMATRVSRYGRKL